jgi:hypothetical protein
MADGTFNGSPSDDDYWYMQKLQERNKGTLQFEKIMYI